ncbi:FAD/NAD(P)-binding domain-containing protein [Xylariaceae sp. AK1471]|nr:FAD/NAD(P)-binding domain-containing protein [Xylariaceae sp. AK1471]
MASSIPEECDVLVIGGGPAGSYAACVLAREGIDTVLLEADSFPRYHIGESLLPSMKYFLEFVDLFDKFDAHGFVHKNGATFKFNSKKPGFTDFLAAGGAGNHSWNVVRSEADHILFKHAGESGAKTFDNTKVNGINFETQHTNGAAKDGSAGLGRPVSASWSQKEGGLSGTIRFKYVVDASGRNGLVSTKYLKNRKYNQGLKSIAIWGYYKNAKTHGPGVGDPFFEAIQDGSGWAWYIPLHNGTVSVGLTMRQNQVAPKKKACGSLGTTDFYKHTLQETPLIAGLLENAQLVSEELKTASDWSYSASEYASQNIRIAGDAGCFIDPLFSSGVHLAMNSGLSAAVTICAALRGHCTEEEAMVWHSHKVAEGYTRFLLVVTSSLEQIYGREDHILSDINDPGFDDAFEHFKPVIQGTIEAGGNFSREEIAQSVNFCTNVISKIESGCLANSAYDEKGVRGAAAPAGEDRKDDRVDSTIMKIVRIHRVLDLDLFAQDVINGMAPNMKRSQLGLVSAAST